MNPARAETIKCDFLEYSGGFTPDEAGDEVQLYVEHYCPPDCTQEELAEFFTKWSEELRRNTEICERMIGRESQLVLGVSGQAERRYARDQEDPWHIF